MHHDRCKRRKIEAGRDFHASAQLQAHKQPVALFRHYAKAGHPVPLKDLAKTLPTLEHHLEMHQAIGRGQVANGLLGIILRLDFLEG